MTCCPRGQTKEPKLKPVPVRANACRSLPARVPIPGGTGLIGTANPHIRADGESPLRRGLIEPYLISTSVITNAEFAAFVEDTGYVTEAEQLGWSFVFQSQLPKEAADAPAVPGSPWWKRIDGASWQCLSGPGCSLVDDLPGHPVVHVSWNDANAYCTWVGGRLPTEPEWENAARGGLGDVRFPWGNDEPNDDEKLFCNIWQGHFPESNTAQDGFVATAPGVSFEPNHYGLYNMVGNVWEWTATVFRTPMQRRQTDKNQAEQASMVKLLKGGSFLCHKSYCYRYRIAARLGNTADSATTHTGFRVVWDIE